MPNSNENQQAEANSLTLHSMESDVPEYAINFAEAIRNTGVSAEGADVPNVAVNPNQFKIVSGSMTIIEAPEDYFGSKSFVVSDGEKEFKFTTTSRVRNEKILICIGKHMLRLKKHFRFIDSQYGVVNEVARSFVDDELLIIGNYSGPRASSRPTRYTSATTIKLPDNTIALQQYPRVRYHVHKPYDDVEHILKDLKGLKIAYISQRLGALVFLSNICFNPDSTNIDDNEAKMMTDYFDYILSNYSKSHDTMLEEAKLNINELFLARKEEEYTQFIDRMFLTSIHSVETENGKIHVDIDAHMRGLNNQSEKLIKNEHYLQELRKRSKSSEMMRRLRADYKLISTLENTGKYRHFRFDGDCIVGQTHDILLFKKHNIGVFDVMLYLDGRVKCRNLTRKANGQYDHPHVNHENPCFGTLGQSIFELLRAHQFGAIFDLLYEFLNTYVDGNQQDTRNQPFVKLEVGWPYLLQEGLELCDNCGRIKELCSCRATPGSNLNQTTCHVCGQSLPRCRCDRCPNRLGPNNIIGTDIICQDEDCDHWDDEDEECTY